MYKQLIDSFGQLTGVYHTKKFLSIPINPLNTDYQEYLQWLAEGNTPDPPDPQPEPVNEPTMQQEIDALKLVVGMLMEEDDDV